MDNHSLYSSSLFVTLLAWSNEDIHASSGIGFPSSSTSSYSSSSSSSSAQPSKLLHKLIALVFASYSEILSPLPSSSSAHDILTIVAQSLVSVLFGSPAAISSEIRLRGF
ncbi:hypothetical protein P171DRAFT_434575 [Karstenula rhodostoma CBS 690.94]|uniref:Uncharacterized protein n=1 Tax=Karstenula rhodostoma CBS 690.94 TaxID=1392251 RepID=A0A9P4PD76_9PLEO|nr:hypothetical protein P171DRAFT_434575 [Karstenula rhodostoma CBS 690.94]